jgi:hypothetical protein
MCRWCCDACRAEPGEQREDEIAQGHVVYRFACIGLRLCQATDRRKDKQAMDGMAGAYVK